MAARANRSSLCLLLLAGALRVTAPRSAAACPKPPRMELRVGRRRQRAARGGYCWGDAERACCIDSGPAFPTSNLYVSLGEAPELHCAELGPVAELIYEIWPSKIVVVDDGWGWTDALAELPIRRERLLDPTSPIRLPGDLPHGLYLVDVFIDIAAGGSSSQGFRLYVGPESQAAIHADDAVPTPGAPSLPIARPERGWERSYWRRTPRR